MEDKLILEILEKQYEDARNRFAEGKHNHEDLTVMMLKHQTNHIAHLEVDLRGDIASLGNEINHFKQEVKEEIKRLDQKVDANTWKMITTMLGLFTLFSAIIITAVKF